MTQKPRNGLGLPKSHSKDELLQLILRLQPDCSVVDLDIPSNQNGLPPAASIGIWVDTWHYLVDALGPCDDAAQGIKEARAILYDLSRQYPIMVFSADMTKPPLDQFGTSYLSLAMVFRESTCYTSVRPIAMYSGRMVYMGENPDLSIENIYSI